MNASEIHVLRAKDQYDYYEFPKVLYRDRPKGFKPAKDGGWVPPEPFETLIVNSAEEETQGLNDGYRLTLTADKAA